VPRINSGNRTKKWGALAIAETGQTCRTFQKKREMSLAQESLTSRRPYQEVDDMGEVLWWYSQSIKKTLKIRENVNNN